MRHLALLLTLCACSSAEPSASWDAGETGDDWNCSPLGDPCGTGLSCVWWGTAFGCTDAHWMPEGVGEACSWDSCADGLACVPGEFAGVAHTQACAPYCELGTSCWSGGTCEVYDTRQAEGGVGVCHK